MSGVLATGDILDRIVARKIEEVKKLSQKKRPWSKTRTRSRETGDFVSALRERRHGRPLIAEIKRASPSAGVIRDPFDPSEIAREYEAGGARCISVLTDEEFFQGSLEVLREVRQATGLPLLRKDFIIDRLQVEDAAWAGADAVLLIARILDDDLLAGLYEHALSLSLSVLIEVHDEKDLERALSLSPAPAMIGVNNRDLKDFSVSTQRTRSLIPLMPKGTLVVSESGLSDPAVLDDLLAAGAGAFLVGTALMKSKDPGRALRRLVYE